MLTIEQPRVDSASPAAAQNDLTIRLIGWYSDKSRDLPWRAEDRTPWGVLVSEIMLQQTPVSRVLPAWTAWMEQWPDAASVAAASPAEVIRAWNRLGYPRRALRLREAAIAVRDEFGNVVPSTYDELIGLPGVGDYTAAAVLTFAFGKRAVVLDTNVRRVLARILEGREGPTSASPTKLERACADAILPGNAAQAARWSIAAMELGALVCRPKPDCAECPAASACAWRAEGYPIDSSIKRRVQKFTGTDRQARGRIMDALRNSIEPISRTELDSRWPDRIQLARALDGLVADGLVEPLPANLYRLPL